MRQLYVSKPITDMAAQKKYFMTNNFKPEERNIQTFQQQQTPVSPYSMPQPTLSNFIHSSPYYNCKINNGLVFNTYVQIIYIV